MIFKNYSESALALADKIKAENLTDYTLTYINPDAKAYCQLLANNLNRNLLFLPNTIHCIPDTKYLLIVDDGSTSSQEYNEFTDLVRKNYPQISISIAIPIIPQSEENQLKTNCDSLITLCIEPLFFSINQFYQTSS